MVSKSNPTKVEVSESADSRINALIELEARHRLEREKIMESAIAARKPLMDTMAKEILNENNPASRQEVEPDIFS